VGASHDDEEGDMRRALVLAVVVGAVLVAVPVAGISDILSLSGGTPSRVFMSVETPVDRFQLCPEDPVGVEPVNFGPTIVEVDQTSHVLVYFTFTWTGTSKDAALVLSLQLEGEDFFAKSADWILAGTGGTQGLVPHGTSTVMWAFDNVPPGDYTVHPTAQIGARQGAFSSGAQTTLHSCALSAFVIPAL
jgi:hypothetical protein